MKTTKIFDQIKSIGSVPKKVPGKIEPPKPPIKKFPPDKNDPLYNPPAPAHYPEKSPEYIEPPWPWPKKGDDEPKIPRP